MTEHTAHARGGVLVGLDGSPASRQALVFAADEARRRDATLTVVTSFEVPEVWWLGPYAVETPSVADRQLAAQRAARKVVDEELGDQPGIAIEVLATTMAPAAALIERSALADLLVVGSRGRGGFRGLLLGSVSMQCVLHAHCPVTVVHMEPAEAAKHPAATPAERGLDDARRMATGTFL